MARGLRDTHYFLKTSRLEGKYKLFNLFSDCPLMPCSSYLPSLVSSNCVGSLRFISAPLTQRKWYMPPVLAGLTANVLLRNPNARLGDLRAGS
jgi:hypothetical protein